MGSKEPFIKKRTEGTERADKAAPERGVQKFFDAMPTWELYTEPSDVDVVIVPAIDGNFDPSLAEMIPVRAPVPDAPLAPELLPAQRAARAGLPDADRRHRGAAHRRGPTSSQRFTDRPYYFVRAATPQVLLDEVDKVL